MTEFENIVIGKSAISSLSVTVILMIAIPVVFFIYWRRKQMIFILFRSSSEYSRLPPSVSALGIRMPR